MINVTDCYADPRFNREADQKSGYRTRCLLTVPLIGHDDSLVGVLQLLNKRHGVFTTAVPVDPAHFTGQGLWLRLAVDGSWLSPRQSLLPVPYAIGLMPRAVVDGDHTDPTLTVRNVSGTGLLVGSSILGIDVGGQTALRATGRGIGIETQGMTGLSAEGDVGVHAIGLVGVRAESQIGRAVEGTSGSSEGVYGESTGGHGVRGKSHRDSGVYGESADGFVRRWPAATTGLLTLATLFGWLLIAGSSA